jgi:hypothetical protein
MLCNCLSRDCHVMQWLVQSLPCHVHLVALRLKFWFFALKMVGDTKVSNLNRNSAHWNLLESPTLDLNEYKRPFCSELLGLWTFSIVRYSRKLVKTAFWKLDLFPSSGEGVKKLLCWVPQKERTSITGQLLSDSHSYLILWDQANLVGDNKKICNKNCDRAPTSMELG